MKEEEGWSPECRLAAGVDRSGCLTRTTSLMQSGQSYFGLHSSVAAKSRGRHQCAANTR